MNMKHFLFLFFFFITHVSFAQDSVPVSQDAIITIDTINNSTINNTIDNAPFQMEKNITIKSSKAEIEPKKKKNSWNRVRILFGINYSFINPIITEKDIYQGPYYPVRDSSPIWLERNTKNNLSKSYKSGNFQFNIQGNFWKGLFLGMNYQFFSVKKYKKDPNLGNLLSKTNSMFFIVSAQFGYVFEFLKNKALQIHPSVRIGGYSADDYYDSGKGKKFYFGTDLQIRYLIKRKAGFSLGFDYDFLHYKKKEYNDIFQKTAYQNTSFSNLHLNAGVYFNISINTKKEQNNELVK